MLCCICSNLVDFTVDMVHVIVRVILIEYKNNYFSMLSVDCVMWKMRTSNSDDGY